MGFIIFSDLDGTLLDHDTYAWGPALPALRHLRREGWPLIPVTSKTRAEVLELYGPLELRAPIVVENGGGIFLPDRAPWDALGEFALGPRDPRLPRVRVLGLPYETVRAFMRREGPSLGMHGFGDLPLNDIARRTGLDPASAQRACARDFSEPFVLDDPQGLAEVRRRAERAGLAVTTGGRFHHLIGAHQSKGRAVRLLADAWRAWAGPGEISVALGDGENDIPMLEEVDLAVSVPTLDRSLPGLARRDAIVAPAPGPAGWNAALLALFAAPSGADRTRAGTPDPQSAVDPQSAPDEPSPLDSS